MSWILSETFAPPRMARKGLSGFSRTLAKYSSSLVMRSPAAFCGRSTPTMDEWARCAVPNASLTKTSPSLVRLARNCLTFSGSALVLLPSLSLDEPSSSMWKRRFSRRKMSPSLASATRCSVSAPTHSGRNAIDLPGRRRSSSAATGLSEYFATAEPLGRPRCDMSTIDLAPWSMAYWIVGSAAVMRCGWGGRGRTRGKRVSLAGRAIAGARLSRCAPASTPSARLMTPACRHGAREEAGGRGCTASLSSIDDLSGGSARECTPSSSERVQSGPLDEQRGTQERRAKRRRGSGSGRESRAPGCW